MRMAHAVRWDAFHAHLSSAGPGMQRALRLVEATWRREEPNLHLPQWSCSPQHDSGRQLMTERDQDDHSLSTDDGIRPHFEANLVPNRGKVAGWTSAVHRAAAPAGVRCLRE